MIKTINTTKQFKIDEIIRFVRESDDLFRTKRQIHFTSDDGISTIEFDVDGVFATKDYVDMHDDTFTVEVKEDITDDMKFDIVLAVYVDGSFTTRYGVSIKEIKQNTNVKQIHATIDNSLELIWEREKQ